MAQSFHEVWLQAYLAALQKDGCSNLAEVQADRCLLEFKRRFLHVFDVPELPY